MNGFEMLIETFLRRLVVIGRDHQGRVGASLLGIAGQGNGFFGGVGAGAGDHRNPAVGGLQAHVDHSPVFVMAEGRRFPGGAARHQAVGSLVDLPVDQAEEGILVDRLVLKRGDQGDQRSRKHAKLPCHSAPCRGAMNPATLPSEVGGGKPMRRGGAMVLAVVGGLLIFVLGSLGGGREAQAGILSASDLDLYRTAFHDAAAGQWSEAAKLAAGAKEPLPAKVIQWLDLARPQSGNSFAAITAFIRANPEWPNQAGLQRQAEAAMPLDLPAVEVRAWFAQHAPMSADGVGRYVDALVAGGTPAKAADVVRRFWVEAGFASVDEETGFRTRFKTQIRGVDDWARLDRLLWDHQSTAARRLLPLVDDGHRAVASARIALADDEPGVAELVKRVPVVLAGDSGLLYERLHWNRRKDNDGGALAILQDPPTQLGRPALWWAERNILVRRLMVQHDAAGAYRLVRAHGMTEGQPLAEAEFLAGFLALRALHQPSDAFAHFHRVYQAVATPMSLARGAYWCGQAAEALHDQAQAQRWYSAAARYPTMFYGQLAIAALGHDHPPVLPPEPAVSDSDLQGFNRLELVRVIRMLHEIDPHDEAGHVGLFLRRAIKDGKGAVQFALLARLADEAQRPDLAIAVAKQALLAGVTLTQLGYPVLPIPAAGGIESGLALAVIRQESTFNTTTISPVGARGLMQLMPATAQQVASKLGLHHDDGRLITDPNYNILLGTTYLGQLIGGYDGSYALAIAAYNAGSGRVRDWLNKFGDPRNGDLDSVDWVESIPIAETRNYVQRVLEALEVYRVRLGVAKADLTLTRDLAR